MLGKSYAEFSADSFALAHEPTHKDLAQDWIIEASLVTPSEKADELTAQRLAKSFTAYLRAGKADERALSTLPPGRFLMPGDLEGSPALTFAPLPDLKPDDLKAGSLGAMMERRYEAYKTYVIKPFFREHIARLDRQIVLIDAMQAMNAGGAVVADLERALTDILSCFRPGRSNLLTGLIQRRIGRILVAATKADHLHHESHDRLQAIVRRLVERAIERADFSGADIDVLAMAAVRATREATVTQGKETLPVIVGTPLKGEKIDGEVFDGETETAIFPGDLPKNPNAIFEKSFAQDDPAIRFVRFRPPRRTYCRRHHVVPAPHKAGSCLAVSDWGSSRMTEKTPRKPASFTVSQASNRPEAADEAPRRPRAVRDLDVVVAQPDVLH